MAAIKENVREHSKRRVAYYYDANIGNFNYGEDHHMDPRRALLAHSLVQGYGIDREIEVHRPFPATFKEITQFHSVDYASFLATVTPDNIHLYGDELRKYNMDKADCPVFEGLNEYCTMSSGGSLAAASKLNNACVDISINWMGGMHHALRDQASGFCYTNDIVLGILELLKCHKRVLYVDIDVHHGDGVEEAFYTTDRVMTVSFHKYDGRFFPRSGKLMDIGKGEGEGYSLNVPLMDGIADDSYHSVFKPIMEKVIERYRPEAIVLQCGADSLAKDKLGTFNLTLKGHGECVTFLRSYRIPLMLVGGGGYTPHNVARCWAYETALAIGKELPDELPYNEYLANLRPDCPLHIMPTTRPDDNSNKYLRKVQNTVLRQLDALPFAPSVQMQAVAARSLHASVEASAVLRDAANPDRRLHHSIMDAHVEDDSEYYDADTESDGGRDEYCWKTAAAAANAAAAKVKDEARAKAAAPAPPALIRRSSRISKPSVFKRMMIGAL